ncbi:MAG: hypothetical protein CM15mV11_0960 [Caudoviricetes sp.]|nr:MAG: hypothetical protein CM15mV11_0960 [Caudoviricetes sp.]
MVHSTWLSTTITIGGSAESVNVLAYDATNKKLEIGLPSGGVTGILADNQVITQGTNTAKINVQSKENSLLLLTNQVLNLLLLTLYKIQTQQTLL